MTSEEVYKEIGGKVYWNYQNNPNFRNSCALRMSRAINQSGYSIPYTKGQTGSGADGNWYFYKVNDLGTYLSGLLGTPTMESTNISDFNGHQGIILFEVSGWSDATGHFTLWNGLQVAHGDYSGQAYNIKLWEIN